MIDNLKEDVNTLYLLEDDDSSSYPKFKSTTNGDRAVHTFIEGVPVLKARDVTKAIQGMLGCYYVFNLEYPEELKSTLSFFQHALLGINDGLKKDAKVTKFLNKLRSS